MLISCSLDFSLPNSQMESFLLILCTVPFCQPDRDGSLTIDQYKTEMAVQEIGLRLLLTMSALLKDLTHFQFSGRSRQTFVANILVFRKA